jgi:hypothetical protein
MYYGISIGKGGFLYFIFCRIPKIGWVYGVLWFAMAKMRYLIAQILEMPR